jgi:CRISPR-associated protein Cas5d
MSETPNLMHLRVWGDFACFTRPEMKVERVSYPLMTPSAARGIFEAIFWEPQMLYLIDHIRVVKKGQWISIKRNEVQATISMRNVRQWMNAPEKTLPIQAGGGAPDGTQRNMLALQDVEYVISAEVRTSMIDAGAGNALPKYLREIQGRASAGKCFHRPGLGMREFAANFEWVDRPDAIPAVKWTEDLGLMLYDVFDHRQRAEGFRWLRPDELAATQPAVKIRGRGKNTPTQDWNGVKIKPQAAFFKASVQNGVMDCHPERVELVMMSKEGDGHVA